MKLNSKIYFFKRDDSFKGEFKEVELDFFKNKDAVMACILLEMDKPEPNKLSSDVTRGSFHFTIYLTKVKTDNQIITYMPNDICILD